MKSTFSRLFALFAVMILICLTVLGVAFRAMFYSYLIEEKQQTLYQNAVAMSKLASVFDARGDMDDHWGSFRIALTSAARVSGHDAILTDPDGEVWMCTCDQFGCSHLGTAVDKDFVRHVLEEERYFSETTLGGNDSSSLVEGTVVRSSATDEIIGLLFVSASPEQIKTGLSESTTIFITVALVVLGVALIVAYLVSRGQTRGLQTITAAAGRFGHGDLDARVTVSTKDSREMEELANAFNTMAESIAQSERQRQEFVANISHELRTPMTSIAGFVDGMMDGTIPQEQHGQYMHQVSDEVRRLSRLVRSMLDISRLRAQGIGEDKKRKFDLCDTVSQVLISFEQQINRKALQVDVQMPDRSVWVKAEPDSITQVIYNLTDNATKFCPPGGSLGVSLETEGGKARVTVRNTGKTIPPEELPLVFDRFHKADKSRSEDKEGVGLGLYIVKTILDSHGENITVTSENDLTVFTFTLPLAR